MPKLSKEKLNEIRQSKNYTIKKLSEITRIPKSTIAKILGGFSKNPTLDNLQKIANALDCGLDDFVEYEAEPSSPFYSDRIIAKLINYLYEKPELKDLVKFAGKLTEDDINLLIDIAKRLDIR